jgi:hypothetical protein
MLYLAICWRNLKGRWKKCIQKQILKGLYSHLKLCVPKGRQKSKRNIHRFQESVVY